MMHKLKMKLTQNKHAKFSADIKNKKARTTTNAVPKTSLTKRSTKFDKPPMHVEFSLVLTNSQPLSAGVEEQVH